jgi:hypothetical protein
MPEPFSSSRPPSIGSGAMECVEYSSSPPVSSPGISLPATPSLRSRGTAADFIQVDWTLWGRQEWAKWPGFERYTGGQDTRAWWQQYGYRVEDHSTSRQGNKLKWICADCFARGFKKKSDFCFVCSTGAAIKNHLRNAHGILVSTCLSWIAQQHACSFGRPQTTLPGACEPHLWAARLSPTSSMPT